MGGDIRVKSRAGFGTNFIVAFPSKTCPEIALLGGDRKSTSAQRKELNGKTCLVVDDLPENTYILRELLQANGMHVLPYNRARPALEWYRSHKHAVDLIITDLRLPEMSGQSLVIETRKLESELRLPRVPIIILTGEASCTEKADCLTQYGADEYLLKPIKLCDLLDCVSRLVSQRRAKSSRNVLIIDDEVLGQKLLSAIIRRNGHAAKSCLSLAEARAEIELGVERYDLIMLDSQLPDGSGTDFLKFYSDRVLMAEGKKKVPVISISGNAVADQERDYAGYTLRGFLQKPVSRARLIQIIESL